MLVELAMLMIHPVAADSFNQSNDRGVFVWGLIGIDVPNHTETYGRRSPLKNCSGDSFYCADGDVFNIVLPKACDTIGKDSVWSSAGLSTRVLGKRGGWPPAETSPPPEGSGEYYVHTNQRPEVVYRWAPNRGVQAIYYDHRGETDFVAAARNGSLHRIERDLLSDPGRQHQVMTLITLDSFAACQPRQDKPQG